MYQGSGLKPSYLIFRDYLLRLEAFVTFMSAFLQSVALMNWPVAAWSLPGQLTFAWGLDIE